MSFLTKWASKIPEDQDLYAARPSNRTVVVRDEETGHDMIVSKLEFQTGEALTQAKFEWLDRIKQTQMGTMYHTVHHHIAKSPSSKIINIQDNESFGVIDENTRNVAQAQLVKHSNFRITAQGFKKFLETDINFMSNRPKSSKPSTTSSSTRKKRSEIVKFENVKDT